MGLGPSLYCVGAFCESEMPILHCVGGEETEAKGSHWGHRTLDRTRLARLVSSSRVLRARAPTHPVGHGTGASGQAPEKLRST
jgi:hypothetical protein